MKTRQTIIMMLIVAAVVGVVIGKRELDWYGGKLAQRGPFYGKTYVGTPIGDATSRVVVAPGFVAETYEKPGDHASVLRLSGGRICWAVLLSGSDVDSSIPIPIHNAILRGVRRWDSGYMILFEGDWEVSGEESGMIYLNSDMELDHYTLR